MSADAIVANEVPDGRAGVPHAERAIGHEATPENWRGIELGYAVSDLGRVRSPRGKVLRGSRTPAGYPTVFLGRGRCRYVHQLVLGAFVGPRPAGATARHLNGQPADNRLANLAWGTWHEQLDDQRSHGTFHVPTRPDNRGERNGMAKLTPDVVREIYASSELERAIAARLGVAPTTVRNIRNGYRWRHITQSR